MMKRGKQDEKTVIEHHTYSMYGDLHCADHGVCGGRPLWGVDFGGGDHIFPENKPEGGLGI